jgi:hypothetical protein
MIFIMIKIPYMIQSLKPLKLLEQILKLYGLNLIQMIKKSYRLEVDM